MSMDSLFTLQTTTNTQSGISKPAGDRAALNTAQTLDFMALILSRLGQNIDQNITASDNGAVKAKPSAMLQTPLSGTTPPLADSDLLQTLSLNSNALDKVLAPLTNGIITTAEIENGSPRILQALLIDTGSVDQNLQLKINALKEKLQNLMKSGEAVAISINLTPEQITALQNAEEGQWPKELDGVMIGLVTLIPPQPENSAQNALGDESKEIEDDPALQNLLVLLAPAPMANKDKPLQTSLTPGSKPVTGSTAPPAAPAQNAANNTSSQSAQAASPGTLADFEGTLQNLESANTPYRKNSEISGNQPQNAQNAPGNTQQNPQITAALRGWSFPVEGSLFASTSDLSAQTGDLGLPGMNAAGNALGTMSLTGILTQAQSAAHAHPATQMVAISLQKSAAQGENRTFVLEMDPPELGRVEIRMTFGKDKAVQATVIAEKPETYLMLQRDAHSLQRVLENTGLDSGGLSFELAGQDHNFTGDNQRGGGHENGGTGAQTGPDTNDNTLQTTMTWHIDPNSGHMRYDILA
ncbi:MAG: flagellar hook-length control protein FliK [Alphaproteobacteria bacterium]|nr:flagellar hook-length control protein FliK [Alphaproteobacteria bacterium]